MDQGFVDPPDPAGQVAELRPEIRIDPESWDFGDPLVGCPLAQSFRVSNEGEADLVVDDLAFDSASSDLQLDGVALPLTLAPGAGIDVLLHYAPTDVSPDTGELVALSDDPARPEASASASGTGRESAPVVDAFDQPPVAASDFLVVVDDSLSMAEEQAGLTGNFQAFLTAVAATESDWRVAVITTDDARFRGTPITAATADPVGEFTRQALVGTGGSPDEAPLEMVFEATSPGGDAAPGGAFFRDDAMLAVVVVTDEPDEVSTILPVELANHLLGLKASDREKVRFHTIGADVPTPACPTAALASIPLDDASLLLGGLFLSVCGDWGVSLSAVAQASVPLLDAFALSAEPVAETIQVAVDGAPASGWVYDPAAQAVVFDAGAVPGPSAHVAVTFTPIAACP
jgi:hypothetical protein